MILVIFGHSWTVNRAVVRLSVAKNSQVVQTLRQELNAFLESMESGLRDVGWMKSNGILSSTELDDYMAWKVENTHFLESILILDDQARIQQLYPYSRVFIGNDMSRQPFIHSLPHHQAVAWSQTVISPEDNQPEMKAVMRFRDFYVLFSFDLGQLFQPMNQPGYDEFGFVFLLDRNGVFISHPDEERVIFQENMLSDTSIQTFFANPQDEKQELLRNGSLLTLLRVPKTGWIIGFCQNQNRALPEIRFYRIILFIITSLILTASILMSFVALRRVVSPLKQLVGATHQVAQGDYSVSIDDSNIREVSELGENFRNMVVDIFQREILLADMNRNLDRAVKERTYELENSLTYLKKSQEKLVQTGRMADLGEMVAGLAHEINTPVGISYTASTHIADLLKRMRKLRSEGHIDNDDWDEFLQEFEGIAEILSKALRRTVDQVDVFKKVSVDQTIADKREFNLGEYTQEVIKILTPQFQDKKVKIDVECPPDYSIHSYPGQYGQILNNLILNSLRHGFTERKGGRITIQILPNENGVGIHYFDDGKGLNSEEREKVFKPFYTTKRSQGGSGLGMHIVYNLVTHLFSGTIECLPAEGAHFYMYFPFSETEVRTTPKA